MPSPSRSSSSASSSLPPAPAKKIIAMLGESGSGKDTAARFVREELPGTATIAFAEPLKELAAYVFGFPNENLWGKSALRNVNFAQFASQKAWDESSERLSKYLDGWLLRVLGTVTHEKYGPLHDAVLAWFESLRLESLTKGLSPRRMLQTLGTECGRTVDADIWASCGLRTAERFLATGDLRCVVITDCRFVNEAKHVRAKGGEVWFMDRPTGAGLAGEAGKHESETAIRTPEMQQYVTHTFRNGGTLEELKAAVGKAIDELFQR